MGPDSGTYVEGEIVHEGLVDNQGDGPYSAGRGGAGNINHDGGNVYTAPADTDMVPETATQTVKENSHHVGRGGAGNEAHVHEKKEGGLMDKVKRVFGSHSDKEQTV